MLHQRLFCTKIYPTAVHHHRGSRHQNLWRIKQVTKSNLSETFEEIKTHISNSDFIAVSLQQTGAYSAPWQRVLPIDTDETAYLKSKRAAERFQVLQFAICPFSVKASKLIVHPYNFHLFPRDELKIAMPSYSFSCQSSYLASMAREGFDFNACIYDGISYLSRAQELAAADRIGPSSTSSFVVPSSSTNSVADSVFRESTKSRVRHWINACKDSNKKTEDVLISVLRKLVSGSEVYGSRPCLIISVCSERQVQLVLEMLKEFVDVVPILVPARGGGIQAVRAVLTSSEEDKNLLEKELQDMEEERNKRVRGFREVIDLISASQKPVVAHNSLSDFTFIYSKFLAPLPSTINEFRSSLLLVFPHVLDVNHLMKEIGPVEKVNNLPASISYLRRKFFAPIDMEVSHRAEADKVQIHGRNVLQISELFAKLCSVLKINPETFEEDYNHLSSAIQCHANKFNPSSTRFGDPIDEDVRIWNKNSRRINIDNLVFLWGLEGGISAGMLKALLHDSHEVFSKEFDVQMVDKNCAVIVFWTPGFSERFLRIMDSGEIFSESLKDMISKGLAAASYKTYKSVCKLGLWEVDLADALDKALEETERLTEAKSEEDLSVINWNNDKMINLDDL
ncbi:poly(A)-specific ribonuclease PARN-like [Olea europaea subsp. europaea]|uniref:Poly(A)-specific ribonuclease PARN-like n=2 Tax=Olea europaea subsp. europaea TaxID=158383 RepID=A0A8S0PSP7_OLEEU|nr:poly(A)-specific ribonuclease PARN-like [Olea europaea subsp. europaea]